MKNSAPILSTGFEGGSAVLTSTSRDTIRMRLRPDGDSPDMNWFYFRLSGLNGQPSKVVIEDAADLHRLAGRDEVPDCWTGYRPFVSHDRKTWTRCDATFVDGGFHIYLPPVQDTIWIAYYPPYPMERHDSLIARCVTDPRCRLEVLGKTPDGHDLELLRIGTLGKPKAWILARQHPSETMAGFFVEGLLSRLLDPADALGRHLCQTFEFFVVPTVNPDGCVRGNTRTNARGMNLNRAWAETDSATAPEVALIRERMRAEGVDFFLDAHGDEELPYVFLGGPLEIPSKNERLSVLFRAFGTALERACPAYSLDDPYPAARRRPRICAWPGIRWRRNSPAFRSCWRCLSRTRTGDPDANLGWNPDRCASLGRSMLEAIDAVKEGLR